MWHTEGFAPANVHVRLPAGKRFSETLRRCGRKFRLLIS
jgi:hypothetical protein